MEFWGDSPNFYNIVIQSPTGERLPVSTALKYGTQELSFVFVETRILVNYIPIERRTGKTLVFFRFLHPAPGIWKLLVEERMPDNGGFHIWLPARGLISDETYFLKSSPEFTITSPGDARDGMTVTAYQYRDNSLYIQASRGYNTENVVKPDFAAPGVGILTASVGAGRTFEQETGTSLAAAQIRRNRRPPVRMGPDPRQRTLLHRQQRQKLPKPRRSPRRYNAVSKSKLGVWAGGSVSYV